MTRTCSVTNCFNNHSAKGFCAKHYQRWKKHGDPLVLKPTGGPRPTNPTPLMDRFWAKVEITDDHWWWVGGKNGAGYGLVWSLEERRDVMAHRVSWEWATGEPLSYELHVDHLCREPSCVNPSHLEPVSPGENTRRGVAAEAWKARCAAITHCPRNHPYDEENTYHHPNGSRICRQCARERHKQRRSN